MAWNISDFFPSWGDAGERPSDNFQYSGADLVNEKHLDYLWYNVSEMEDEVRSALTDIDSDKDGIVDEADTANLYKGNDIDSDGDGVVDAAENATQTYKTSDLDHDYCNADGGGTVASGDAGLLYSTEVPNGGTLEVYHASLTSDGGAAPNGTSIRIITLDGSGGGTDRSTVLSGDGTMQVGVENDPIASWENTTGSPQSVALVLDNGHFDSGSGSNTELEASVTARVV